MRLTQWWHDQVRPDSNGVAGGPRSAWRFGVQRIIAISSQRCVGNTLLLNGRTYSPPYTIRAVGDASAMQAALSEVAGYPGPVRMRYAKPAGPLGY
jgi:hypothetical protein